jgi:hypothetical protein
MFEQRRWALEVFCYLILLYACGLAYFVSGFTCRWFLIYVVIILSAEVVYNSVQYQYALLHITGNDTYYMFYICTCYYISVRAFILK